MPVRPPPRLVLFSRIANDTAHMFVRGVRVGHYASLVLFWVPLACGYPSKMMATPHMTPSKEATDRKGSGLVRVIDSTTSLTYDERGKLTTKLERIAHTTTGNVAVLIAPTLKGETIEHVAATTFKSWQLGVMGILVVVAVEEKQSRIETGPGVERILTDDKAAEIQRANLVPHLRQGDFYGGLDDSIEAITTVLEAEAPAGSPQR